MDKIFFKINYFSKILPIKSNYLEIISNCQCFPAGENSLPLCVLRGQRLYGCGELAPIAVIARRGAKPPDAAISSGRNDRWVRSKGIVRDADPYEGKCGGVGGGIPDAPWQPMKKARR